MFVFRVCPNVSPHCSIHCCSLCLTGYLCRRCYVCLSRLRSLVRYARLSHDRETIEANFKRHWDSFRGLARRAMYMTPLFWQALETRANFYENPRQTSIVKTNDAVMKSERNALVIGSPIHPSVTVLTPRSVTCGVGCPGV